MKDVSSIFHNLRSSRQTELEERFPRKTVCEWMGNSETVADQNYPQVLEEHFDRAVLQNGSDEWLVDEDQLSQLTPAIVTKSYS